MFTRIPCTDIGLSPDNILNFMNKLENGLNMHSVLMMKGDDVFYEAYWAPFTRDSLQRMYSQTKSLNGIAIGMLEHEGKLKLDDPLYTYFPEKIDTELPKELKAQTIRDTLMMCTCTECPSWFTNDDRDRVHLYFNSPNIIKPAGTLFSYDSAGSQVLSCLVEKLSGMNSLEYIKSKVFAGSDILKGARILKTPTGEAWGDSGLICRVEDIAAIGRFVMKCKAQNGGGFMSPEYIHDAVSNLISTNEDGFFSHKAQGYGYQIWHTLYDGFAFFGMGNQLTICIPQADLLFSCTADDQGYGESRRVLMDALYEYIVEPLMKAKNEETYDKSGMDALNALTSSLKLHAADGMADSPIVPRISGVTYSCEPNPMGIKSFCLNFKGNELEFNYETDRGSRIMVAGCMENRFDYFPEEGYSDEVGGEAAPGHKYHAAFSYAFRSETVLMIQARIIDEYLGNLTILFGFGEDSVGIKMVKNAENFMNEYSGRAIAFTL